MTVMTQKYIVSLTRYGAVVKEPAQERKRSGPRRCMIVSVGMILAGMGIPFLMALGDLPLSFVVAFVGFALTAAGGVLALFFCGEI